MQITVATLRNLRADIGDTGERAFSDAELAALYTKEGGNYDRAVEAGLWRLVSNAALFDRYMEGASPEERTEAHKQLLATYRAWRTAHVPTGGTPRIGQGGMVLCPHPEVP